MIEFAGFVLLEPTEPQRVLYFVSVYLILMVLIETYPNNMFNYHIVNPLAVLENIQRMCLNHCLQSGWINQQV